MARLLAPEQFGIYAVALATQGILFAFAAFSVTTYIVREANVDRAKLRRTFTVNTCLSVLLTGSLWVAALLCDENGVDREVGVILRILSLGPLISAVEFIPSSLLLREMNFRILSLAGMLRAVLTTTVSITLAVEGLGATSLAVGHIFGMIASAVMLNVAKRRELVFLPTFTGLWPVMKFGAQLVSISGVAQLATRASDLILARLLGLAAIGLYARASTISSMIFENVYGLITGVLFTKMSSDLREKGTIHDVYLRSLRLITGGLWPALLGMAILAQPMVHILYGERWLPAALPLSLLMISQIIVLSYSMTLELFILRHETGRQTRIEVIRAISSVTFFSFGAMYSIAAAAVGRVIEAIVGYLLYRPHLERLAGLAPGELRQVYSESALLTAVAVAPALVLMLATDWRSDVNPGLIAGAVLLGGLAWFAMLLKRDHVIIQELKILQRFALRRA